MPIDREIFLQDADAFIDAFGELVTYKPNGGRPRTIYGIVNRQPPGPIKEDDHVLADDIWVTVKNSATQGVFATEVVPQKDEITVSGRYGGTAEDKLIVRVAEGDGGMIVLHCR